MTSPGAETGLVRRRVRVRGQVQGVWFRASTQQAAEAAGVTGWVRNCADGSVEAEVQGSAAAVEVMARFCASGPPRARVTEVTATDVPTVADETGFQVR